MHEDEIEARLGALEMSVRTLMKVVADSSEDARLALIFGLRAYEDDARKKNRHEHEIQLLDRQAEALERLPEFRAALRKSRDTPPTPPRDDHRK